MSMSTVSLGLIGVVCGLAVATFGYVAVLPFVLKSQERLPAGYVMPILGWRESTPILGNLVILITFF